MVWVLKFQNNFKRLLKMDANVRRLSGNQIIILTKRLILFAQVTGFYVANYKCNTQKLHCEASPFFSISTLICW